MLSLELPCGGGHRATDFVGKVDAGLLAEAYGCGVLRDGVDTQAVRKGVVEGVAGVGDGVIDVDRTVMFIAGVKMTIELGAAVTTYAHGLSNVLLEASESHDDFEGAAWSELGLNGLVQERVVGVVEDLVPIVLGKSNGKLVGIEGGAGGHRQNFTRVRVHGHDSADLTVEGFFSGHLDVEVDCELEVFARGGKFLTEVAKLFSVAVDDDVTAAVDAAEQRIVGLLNARAAYDIARGVEGIARVVEHLFGDFADVPDEVSGESVAGVEAALLVEGF